MNPLSKNPASAPDVDVSSEGKYLNLPLMNPYKPLPCHILSYAYMVCWFKHRHTIAEER